MPKAVISGTGLYVPKKCVKNSYFNDLYKKDIDSFLIENRNIHQRYFMAEDQATSDLIVPAAQRAMDDAEITAKDLDLIIVSTDTPDYLSPSTASVVQHKLQATQAGSYDINSACAGFVTALDQAYKYIQSDKTYRNILVVGAYGMSKYLNFEDFKIATLFADGAGAVVVQSQPGEQEHYASQLMTVGMYHDYMGIYAGGTYEPITEKGLENKRHLLDFAKKIPIETNATYWPKLAHNLLDRLHLKLDQIDHFVFTQININSIRDAMDKMKVPHERAHNIMDRFGYTGSACIPMALADGAQQNKYKAGDKIMLLSSGGGMSLAANIITWTKN